MGKNHPLLLKINLNEAVLKVLLNHLEDPSQSLSILLKEQQRNLALLLEVQQEEVIRNLVHQVLLGVQLSRAAEAKVLPKNLITPEVEVRVHPAGRMVLEAVAVVPVPVEVLHPEADHPAAAHHQKVQEAAEEGNLISYNF